MRISEGVQGWSIYKNDELEKFRYNPYRLYNRRRAEWAYKYDFVLPFPLHLIVETSSFCQLKCGFCNREAMARPQRNMLLETFKQVVDEAAENQVYSLSLYCLGEPFMNPDLREMVIYAKRKGIPYVDVSTNGMLPMDSMLGTGLNELIVSLDGFEHDKLRQGADIKKIMRNVIEFKLARSARQLYDPIIRIQTIDFGGGVDEKFLETAQHLGDVVYVKNLEIFSQNLGDKNLPQAEIEQRKAQRKACKQLWFCLTVDSDGTIEYCCHSPQGKAKLGHIKEITLKEAWNELRFIRQNHYEGRYTDMCINCVDWEW